MHSKTIMKEDINNEFIEFINKCKTATLEDLCKLLEYKLNSLQIQHYLLLGLLLR
ncbi:MAG: hypothetical protein KatS3mg003_0254 [Candidatus Nitrosocaldaceae archaeon]|nr:MAG: hypothetical protein KatS3mg003_0254 [Candidatus Nitrosocaldaceae archaeon]